MIGKLTLLAPMAAGVAASAQAPLGTLQALMAVCWVPAAVYYSKAVVRMLSGRGTAMDTFRALLCFVALTNIGFGIRWLVFPHAIEAMAPLESSLWAALYILSTLEGLGLFVASFFYDRLRGKR